MIDLDTKTISLATVAGLISGGTVSVGDKLLAPEVAATKMHMQDIDERFDLVVHEIRLLTDQVGNLKSDVAVLKDRANDDG